jgi:hypothetical protein
VAFEFVRLTTRNFPDENTKLAKYIPLLLDLIAYKAFPNISNYQVVVISIISIIEAAENIVPRSV